MSRPPEPSLPAAWQGILHDGERILWQGGPQKGLFWRKHYNRHLLGPVIALAVPVFMPNIRPWVFPAMLVITLVFLFGPLLRDSHRRRHSFFTLTDKRAFIGTDLPFWPRQLASYPITADTELSFRRDGLSAVYFAHEMRPGRNSQYRVDIGFENIADGEEVYRLMKQVKEGTL